MLVSDMKRYIIYILIFFASVAVFDQVVGLAGDYMQHHSKPGPSQQFDDLCLNDQHDIFIMGSSRAHHHYVPQILEDSLGVDVYNAGYDGNGVILSYGILQMILEKQHKPKCIIYDVEPAFDIDVYEPDNNRTRYLSTLKRYYTHEGVKELLKDVSWETYVKSYSGLCRYNSVFMNSVREYFKGGAVYEKGYQPLYGEIKSEPEKTEASVEPVIDKVKVKYLCKFIESCKDNDIQLILALSPKYRVADVRIQDFVRNLASKYVIPMIDYYRDEYFQNDMTLFKEPMHLNDKGANYYSQTIVPNVREIISKNMTE